MKGCALFIILSLVTLTSCEKNQALENAKELNEAEFHEFISHPGTLNIVDFYADWCGVCKQLAPTLSAAVEENADIVRLGKVDVDRSPELATRQGVLALPDIRFYIDGKLVHKFAGGYPREYIDRVISIHRMGINKEELGAPPAEAIDSSKHPNLTQ